MFLFWVLIIIFLPVFALWWYQNFSHVGKHLRDLPGPGIPIFGVLFDYVFGDLEKIFKNDRDRCARYSPIFKFWLFNFSTIILQDPNDIETVLSSTKHIKKSRTYDILHMWLGTGLLTSEGEKWKLRRKMLTPAFHFTILKSFVDIFNEATQNLLDDLSQYQNFIDVIPPITEFTLSSIAETSMGISLKNEATEYKKAILKFSEIAVNRLGNPLLINDNVFKLFPISFRANKILSVLHGFTKRIIKERKTAMKSYSNRKRLAMLDLLLKAQEVDGSIDDEGIREEVDTFMFEGHDTTAVAICHLLCLLANNPQAQAEARQEIIDLIGKTNPPTFNDLHNLPYTERCIKECLRLYPSVVLIGRDIKEDFKTASGHVVPKGTMVHIFIFDLHRNSDLYPDPEKFDPDRFLPENVADRHPFAYIPFSAGSRNCIGQKFAMLELKAVLCGVLRKFILEPLDKPKDDIFQADFVLRRKNPIRVKFVPMTK